VRPPGTEGFFPGHDGTRLFYRLWSPEGAPRATVAFVHGFGDHSGRHPNLVCGLSARGMEVCAFDLRGHGRSDGRRGHVDGWDDYREDLRRFLALVRRGRSDGHGGSAPPYGGGPPLFLMGHSMGGLIVLEFALRSPSELRGVIASSPAVGRLGVAPWKMSLGRLLSRLWPRFSMEAGLDSSGLSRDPDVRRAIRDDPLSHGRGTARLALETTRAVEWTREHAADLRVPLLLLHGGADIVVGPEACRTLYENVRVPDKTRLEYEGAFHELDNDLGHERVVADVAEWIECRSSA